MMFSGPSVCRPSPLALILIGITSIAGSLNAAEWRTQLGNGQPIVVDPTTNRAVIQSGIGQGRPLWDGVHRLQNGSTITIRSGIVVPNEALSSPTSPMPSPAVEISADTTTPDVPADQKSTTDSARAPANRTSRHRGHCDHLVLKTCGLNGGCDDAESCHLARQLRKVQQKAKYPGLGNIGWAEERCREALMDDDGLSACEIEPALDEVACGALVERVCASASRCRRSRTCRDVRELFDLEQIALEKSSPTELELVRQRCTELLGRHAFFRPCR